MNRQIAPDSPTNAAFEQECDRFLAAAIAGDTGKAPSWPEAWREPDMAQAFSERALYHGLAGILVNRPQAMSGWSAEVVDRLKQQALGQGMWELRHRLVVVALVEALAQAGVTALLLKGTALAYDLYADPAERCRGDSDILVSPAKVATSRKVLLSQGFIRESVSEGLFGDLHAQEIWRHVSGDGYTHTIDLHWQLLNSPFLDPLMPYAECVAAPVAIPRLSRTAYAMPRVMMLIHACLHRAVHVSNPYYVDGKAYLGGGRLIWLLDIKLIAAACTNADWAELIRLAGDKGLSALCRDALEAARDTLGAPVPAHVIDGLARAHSDGTITAYLTEASQFGRAWRDLSATRGAFRKLRFALAQILPSPEMVREKYPTMRDRSIVLLYGRRLGEIFGRRVSGPLR